MTLVSSVFGEGNTPLIKLENILCEMGSHVELYIKYEGLNPTGSFKDRGMTMAVTKAVESDSKAIICASTGKHFSCCSCLCC